MIIQLVELVKIIFSGLSDKRFEQTSEDAVERVRERQGLPLWRVVKRVIPGTQGFIVTTRFKPKETVEFMHQMVSLYPELRVFRSDEPIPDKLYETDAGQCCYLVKVEPTRRAIEEMNVAS